MTTFDTPRPPTVTIDLGVVGDVRVVASDRADTVVEVRPQHEDRASDVRAAAQTRIEQVAGRIVVNAPRHWRQFSFVSNGGGVDVTVLVPTGADIEADLAMGRFISEGRLGRSTIGTAYGDVRTDQTDHLTARTGYGDATIGHVAGDADVKTGSGTLRIGSVTGAVTLKNSNGATTVEHTGGDLHAHAANGDITVGRAEASVTARSANGSIRVGNVVRGATTIKTAAGHLEVGIRPGTAAWIDASSHAGTVRNHLDVTSAPADTDETVEVSARTSYGDITIRRATH